MSIPQLANRIITGKAGRFLKSVWYRCMISWPVARRVFGLKIYFDSRDNPFVWFSSTKGLEDDENLRSFLETKPGVMWDVGCNVGLYSLYAASLGWRVIAFDLSPKAISLLQKSAKANGLQVTGLAQAFTLEPMAYSIPATATAGNRIDAPADGERAESTTWRETEKKFGTPNLIKMDIEGCEKDFLESAPFTAWLKQNRITWLVEMHGPACRDALAKHHGTARQLSQNNFAIEPAKG